MDKIPKHILIAWILEYKNSEFEQRDCLDGLLNLIEEYK